MKEEKNWSEFAKDFDELQRYVVGKNTMAMIETELGNLYKLGKLLELGCGNGKYTTFIAKAATNIIATDLSEDMLKTAKMRLKDFANIKLEQSDCYKTKYPEASFDTVFMANLIHVVLEPAKTLKETWRIIKNNGRIVILSFTVDGMKQCDIKIMKERYLESFGKFPAKTAPMMLDDLIEYVKDIGFTIQHASLIGDKTKAMFLIANK